MSRFRLIAAGVLATLLFGWLILQSQKDKFLYLRTPGIGNEIRSIAFAPDGSTVAFASWLGESIHVWDLKSKSKKFVLNCPIFTDKLQYTDSGELVQVSSADSGRITLWDSEGKVIGSYRDVKEYTLQIKGISKSCRYAESEFKARSGEETIIELKLFDVKSGDIVDSLRCAGLFKSCFIYSNDGCSFGLVMMPHNPEDRSKFGMTVIANLSEGSFKVLPVVTCTPGNTRFSLISDDIVAIYEGEMNLGRGVRVWDLKSGEHFATIPYDSMEFPPIVKPSPDRTKIAVAGGDLMHHTLIPLPDLFNGHHGEVKLWDIAESKSRKEYKTDRIVTAIEFSPDGRRVAVGFEDGTVEILNESFTMTRSRK